MQRVFRSPKNRESSL
jgi:hypothetical protein